MRVRSPFLWGWNETVASRVTVPMLIIAGEFDRGDGGIQALAELYQTVQSPSKLRFKVQCAGTTSSLSRRPDTTTRPGLPGDQPKPGMPDSFGELEAASTFCPRCSV